MAGPSFVELLKRQALRREGRRPAVAGGGAYVQLLERRGDVPAGDSRGDMTLILAVVKERIC
jgi:hypothetical protein